MAGISETTYLSVLDGVRRLHAARGLEDLRSTMLDVVCGVVNVGHACYNEIDLVNNQHVSFFDEPEIDLGMSQFVDAFSQHMGEHPILNVVQNFPDAGPQRLSDFLSQRQLHSLGLYREVYGPLDTNYQMIVNLDVPRRAVVGLALNRERADFTEEDRAALALLDPHLRQAYETCRRQDLLRVFFNGRATDALIERLVDSGLSGREAEICFYIAQSKTNGEIAMILEISPLTAKTHVENIFRKLEVAGRVEAIRSIVARLMDGD